MHILCILGMGDNTSICASTDDFGTCISGVIIMDINPWQYCNN